MADDPDVAAGRAIAAGRAAPSSTTTDDPDVAAGRAIATTAGASSPQDDATKPDVPLWQSALGYGAGLVHSFTHGLSFGLDNPLDRATAALFPNSAFAQQQKEREGAQKQFDTAHPFVSGAAEVAGSAPTFLMGEGALAPVIPGVIGRGAGLVDKGLNLLGASARSAVVSGAAGAGMSEGDLTERAKSGAEAAAVGAVAPGAFAAIGSVLKSATAPIMARILPSSAEKQGLSKVAQALARDNTTPAEAMASMQALGPDAALVDTGGRNVRGLGESVASIPGEGAQLAESFLENRAAGQQGRLNTAITAATGSDGDYHAALGDLATKRATEAAPRYDASFNRIVTTPEEAARVQRFIGDPIGQDAMQKGLRIIQLENLAADRPFNPADYGVTRGENGKFELGSGVPTLRLMDAVKRGYDEIVEGFRDTTTGKLVLNQYGRAVNNVRATYVAELRDMFPRYAGALDAWGGPSSAMDALSLGRRALSNDPEVTAKTIAGLSSGDKEFFKTGVARALKDKAESVQDGADATRRIFGNTLIRNKIAAAFGDPNAFREFQTTMEREATFARTRNEVLKGSQTARRRAGQEDSKADILTPLGLLATGHPLAAAAHLGGQGVDYLSGPGGPKMAAIGRHLFTPGGMSPATTAAMTRAQNPLLPPTVRAVGTMAANRLTR